MTQDPSLYEYTNTANQYTNWATAELVRRYGQKEGGMFLFDQPVIGHRWFTLPWRVETLVIPEGQNIRRDGLYLYLNPPITLTYTNTAKFLIDCMTCDNVSSYIA